MIDGAESAFDYAGRELDQRRAFFLAWVLSVGAHLVVLAALYLLHTRTVPTPTGSLPITVNFVELPEPIPAGPLTTPQETTGGLQKADLQAPASLSPVPVPTSEETPVANNADLLSEAEIAGAITATENGLGGGGAGGGTCDTARMVQEHCRATHWCSKQREMPNV